MNMYEQTQGAVVMGQSSGRNRQIIGIFCQCNRIFESKLEGTFSEYKEISQRHFKKRNAIPPSSYFCMSGLPG